MRRPRKKRPKAPPVNWKAPVMGQWKIVDSISAMGRSRDEVLCPCGARTWIFPWSMHGHGYRRCDGCGRPLLCARNGKRDVLDDPFTPPGKP